MNTLVVYLIKSGIALALFYFVYWLFHRKDTHFELNRFILIASLLLSLALPFININTFITEPVIPTLVLNLGSEQAIADKSISIPSTELSFWKVIAVLYFSGATIVLLRLVYQAIYMQALSRLSKSEKMNGFTLVKMEKDITPFSYFNKIFIPASKTIDGDITSIIDHEKSHLRQYHFLDLLLAEFITIIQWFNPFAWLYERSVKEVHEYLADKAVLQKGYSKGTYQALLVNQAMGGPVFTITHQFNHSLIKKRIVMMTKSKSPSMAKLKALMLLPVIVLILLAYNKPEIEISSFQGIALQDSITVSGIVTNSKNEAVSNAIVIVKGTTTGVITDLEGKYRLKANMDDVLVYSFVGYKTQQVPIKGQATINVELEYDALTIDFSKNSLVAAEKTDHSGTIGKDAFVVVEEPPTYPGGTDALKKFINENIQYPADAKNKKIEGKVIVNFIIDNQGNVVNPKIMRGTAPSLDVEALRVTKLIKGWQSAKQNGKPVSYRIIMPIEFKL